MGQKRKSLTGIYCRELGRKGRIGRAWKATWTGLRENATGRKEGIYSRKEETFMRLMSACLMCIKNIVNDLLHVLTH